MEVAVGAARYGDLNSDLPICITQDFLLIQSVTGLVASTFLSSDRAHICIMPAFEALLPSSKRKYDDEEPSSRKRTLLSLPTLEESSTVWMVQW